MLRRKDILLVTAVGFVQFRVECRNWLQATHGIRGIDSGKLLPHDFALRWRFVQPQESRLLAGRSHHDRVGVAGNLTPRQPRNRAAEKSHRVQALQDIGGSIVPTQRRPFWRVHGACHEDQPAGLFSHPTVEQFDLFEFKLFPVSIERDDAVVIEHVLRIGR